MDEVLIHIPKIRTFQLFDVFYKEESFFKSKKEYCFELFTGSFLKRINELEKLLSEEKNYNIEEKIINSKKDNILEYIDYFKKNFIIKLLIGLFTQLIYNLKN